jgi:hypothetical protein
MPVMDNIEVDIDDEGYILLTDGKSSWMRKEYIFSRYRDGVTGEYDTNKNIYGFDNDQWSSLQGRSGLVEIKDKRIVVISVGMWN